MLQKNKNGKTTLVTGNPIFNDRGEIFRIVNVRDITELMELKQKLDQIQGLSEHYASQLQHLKMKYVRIIAGTNRHLSEMVINRTFREDLFYRRR